MTYTYYDNGSREIVTIKDTAGSSITTVNTYTYDTRNRLTEIGTRVNNVLTKTTGYTYDNNGNQLTTVVKSYADRTTVTSTATTLTNTYDLYNQLTHSITENGTAISNTYNAEGYRVGKDVITGEGGREYTRYLYEADKVILETSEAGDLKARNIYGTNLLIRVTCTETYQYLYNGHADVTALITREGNIAATYYYDAFGNILESTGNVDNSILYAGYQYDEEAGLYYLNARMYDPVTARFLQEDTYKGDPNDPLSLNLYTYSMNNPIRYIDPSGHKNIIAEYKEIKDKEMEKKLRFKIDIYHIPDLLSNGEESQNVGSDSPTEGTGIGDGVKDYIGRYPKEYIDGIIKAYESHKMVNGRFVLDNGGKTIGYGHDLLPGEDFSNGLSEKEALDLLIKDLDSKYDTTNMYVNTLNSRFGYNINIDNFEENEILFLVDFAFNRGPGLVQRAELKAAGEPFSSLAILITAVSEKDDNKIQKILMEETENTKGVYYEGLKLRRMDEYEILKFGDFERDYDVKRDYTKPKK